MRLPIITSRRDVEVRIVSGQSVLELFQQIRNVLQRELPEAASLFAEPIVNPVRDEIAWSTRLVGEIRGGADFSPEEFSKVLKRLEDIFTSLNDLIERLSLVGKVSIGSVNILRAMLVTPGLSKSVFLVGDSLVLTQWGCYTFGCPESSADIFKEISSLKPSPVSFSDEAEPSSQQNELAQTHQPRASYQEPASEPRSSLNTEPEVQKEIEGIFKPSGISDSPHPEQSSPLPNLQPFLWWLLAALLLALVIGLFMIMLNEFDRQQVERLASKISLSQAEVLDRASKCRESRAPAAAYNSGVTPLEMWSRRYEAGAPEAVDNHTNVSLAWNSIADLDLIIQQPDGQTVYFGRTCRGDSCGLLDVDANRCTRASPCEDLTTRPLENISWSGAMLPGRYVISVMLYDIHPNHALKFPIQFTIEVSKRGEREIKNGRIEKTDVRCGERCSAIATQFHMFLIK